MARQALITLALFALAFVLTFTQVAAQDDDITSLEVTVQGVDAQIQLVPTDKATISAEADGKSVNVEIDTDTATATINLKTETKTSKPKATRSKSKATRKPEKTSNGSDSAGLSTKTASFALLFVLAITAVFNTVYGRRSSSLLVTLAAVSCVVIACLTTTSEGEVNATVDVTIFIPSTLNLISHQYYIVYIVTRGNTIIFFFFPVNKNLALVAATSPARLSAVASGLSSVGFTVTTFDATTATPTVDQLVAFKYVLVFSDPLHTFLDKVALGDNLASAYDSRQRVRVVTATFANAAESPLGGKFGTVANGYLMLDNTISTTVASASLGATLAQDTYLTTNVATFSAQLAYATTNSLANGARAGVAWTDGRPLIAVGKVGRRRKTDINFFPVTNSTTDPGLWVGDGWTLLRNAISYSS